MLGRASRVAGRLHVGATARAVLRGASRPVLLLRRPLGSRGAVVAAAPAPGEGDAALQAAVAWAQALDAPLVALARPGSEAAETDRRWPPWVRTVGYDYGRRTFHGRRRSSRPYGRSAASCWCWM